MGAAANVRLTVTGCLLRSTDNGNLLARLMTQQGPLEVQRPRHGTVADRGDDVARLQSALCGRAFLVDLVDDALPSAGRAGLLRHDSVPGVVLLALINSAATPMAMSTGIAKPMPWAPARTATLMPIISPSMFNSGPPELPGLMLASV